MNKYVKSFPIGIILSVTVVIFHLICCVLLYPCYSEMSDIITAVIFSVIMIMFLTCDNIACLLIRGFTALFLMFCIEIPLMAVTSGKIAALNFISWFNSYIAAFFGSAAGVFIAMLLTLFKVKFSFIKIFIQEGENNMENSLKLKLVVYSVISAAGFSYLVLPEKSGIGVFIFTVMQALCLWFLAPDRKKIWLFLPVILFGANAFISGNNMWRMPNLFISVFIYALMFIDFNPADTALKYFNDIIVRILEPVTTFRLPFIWAAEINREKAPVIKRIFKAFIITVPCIILLIYLLSNADMIFSKGVSQCFDYILEFIRPSAIFKIILGIFAGLYLFGILYAAYTKPKSGFTIQKNIRGDVLISNIFLISALAVYTIFVIIQFKYLFAGGQLPYGLTYTEYARKGFFELLALSFVNILIILIIVNITKGQTGQGLILSKILCCYLCAVTLILLASSFYRMWLYNIDDGLTRLRFMVFGFLIFEAAGLIVTFIYIIKPKSHISSIYLAIALCYYSLLNIVPMDFFIAQNQINKYLNGEREDLAYIFTLSSDAAVPISRLSDDITNRHKFNYSTYFNSLNDKNSKLPKRWQRYNLSLSHAEKICESLDLKNDTFFTQS